MKHSVIILTSLCISLQSVTELFVLTGLLFQPCFVNSLQLSPILTKYPSSPQSRSTKHASTSSTLFNSAQQQDEKKRFPRNVKHFIFGQRDGKRRSTARNIKSFLPSTHLNSSKSNSVIGSSSSNVPLESKLNVLEQENELLRINIQELQKENHALECQRRIVIEKFEGEGLDIKRSWWDDNIDSDVIAVEGEYSPGISTATAGELVSSSEECDSGYDDTCPIEPDVSFKDALRDRAYWLVGLLALQSMSGFILAKNEALLQTHPVIIYFLTMLVGAGGNAGNQASVRVIRGIALGTLNDDTQRQFLNRELKMALSLSCVLSLAGFIRAAVFRTPFAETIAITTALSMIVFSSICLGAILPLILRKLKVDPAHSSTTIQVIMDILGVVLTVVVSSAILDSPLGKAIVGKLVGNG